MKAKNRPSHSNQNSRSSEPLPHEMGAHLFAIIRRNLRARHNNESIPARQSQLTFAF